MFIATDVTSQPILGLKTSTQLNLVKWIMNIDKTPDPKLPTFREIGCLHNEHHIVVDNSEPPTVNPPRRIPIALKEKINNELHKC